MDGLLRGSAHQCRSHCPKPRNVVGDEPEEHLDSLRSDVPVSKLGDLWQLRDSRLICGDSTQPSTIATLMAGRVAAMAFCDPPFGCPIDGFVSGKGRHREFVEGSVNVSEEELSVFFTGFIAAFFPHLKSGASSSW